MTFFLKKNTFQFTIIIISFFLCFISNLQAQESTTHISDSLLNTSIKELVQLIKTSKNGEASFFEKVVVERSEENEINLIYYLGKQFSKEENYTKGHYYLDNALVIATENEDQKYICKIIINKARAYMLDGKNQQAVYHYSKAIDIAKKYRYEQLEVIAMSGYMTLLSQIDDQLDQALEICYDLIYILEHFKEKNTKYHVRILTSINDVFLEAERYDDVLFYADKGIKIADSLDFKIGLLDLYVKKGIAHYYKKENKKSHFFLQKAKEFLDSNDIENTFHQKVKTNYFLAKLKYDDGLYPNAIQYLTTTVNTIKEEDTNKLPIIQTYYLLMESHREIGEDKQALKHYDTYTELNKVYQRSENKTRNRIFEREIDAFEERVNLEKKNKWYAQTGLFIVLALLLIVGYSFWKKQTKNKALFNDLISQIDQFELQQLQKEKQEKKKITPAIAIDDDKVTAVLKGLSKLEKQEYFLRPDCNLRTIAKKTKTNATYLSQIINAHKGKNFNGYINDLRITYTLKKLKDDKRFRSFSIASISLEVGYKSDKSFVKHFKSKTGINPSYYIKNLETLQNNAA